MIRTVRPDRSQLGVYSARQPSRRSAGTEGGGGEYGQQSGSASPPLALIQSSAVSGLEPWPQVNRSPSCTSPSDRFAHTPCSMRAMDSTSPAAPNAQQEPHGFWSLTLVIQGHPQRPRQSTAAGRAPAAGASVPGSSPCAARRRVRCGLPLARPRSPRRSTGPASSAVVRFAPGSMPSGGRGTASSSARCSRTDHRAPCSASCARSSPAVWIDSTDCSGIPAPQLHPLDRDRGSVHLARGRVKGVRTVARSHGGSYGRGVRGGVRAGGHTGLRRTAYGPSAAPEGRRRHEGVRCGVVRWGGFPVPMPPGLLDGQRQGRRPGAGAGAEAEAGAGR